MKLIPQYIIEAISNAYQTNSHRFVLFSTHRVQLASFGAATLCMMKFRQFKSKNFFCVCEIGLKEFWYTYNNGNTTNGKARITRPMVCSGRYHKYTMTHVMR